MKFEANGNILTVFLEGRIDSTNAEAVGTELAEILAANPQEELILDVENVAYISSAGLRVVLRTKKQRENMEIVNASPDVYEIFEMTGFTEMLPVKKAYRRLSVDGCEVIGQGANGKVYRLDADTIIKVYTNPESSLEDIHRERELARKAFVMGIPTAIPYDVVRVGDGYGSVFELLNANSFAKLIAAEPDRLDEYAGMYTDLLKKIHATELKPGEMLSMKEYVLSWVPFLKDYLPSEQYDKLYALVDAIPETNHMMHGDFHIKNVMMQDGEVLLIDMDTLCVGDPVFEFTAMYMAYKGFSENDHTISENFLGIPHGVGEELWRKTLRLYFGTDDEKVIADAENKAIVLASARMLRRTIRRGEADTALGKLDIASCKRHLAELLPVIDSLSLAK